MTMLPHRVPPPKDGKTARAHLLANVQAAATGDMDPGHWQLHHITLPADRPGDFTPIRPPEYAEQEVSPAGELLGYLAEFMLAAGAAQRLAEHQPQADPEPG
jgi:hypothetical protein